MPVHDERAIASTRPLAEPGATSSGPPEVERLVDELIGRVADKWTMIVLELLEEYGTMRFTELSRSIGTISQKMLTQTLRAMERDGLVTRTIHPVIPPRVDYTLTDMGRSLGAAFCGVWIWAEANMSAINEARAKFDDATGKRPKPSVTLSRR
jgi:DNA-binding HxlR family transcriptional regulator